MSKNLPSNIVITYVTRDIERALGMNPSAQYQIITNDSLYSQEIKSRFPDYVHLIDSSTKEGGVFDTWEILEHPKTKEIIEQQNGDKNILVFKNTSKIEEICKKNNWNLLNPSSELAEKIENKITQVDYLGEIGKKFLPHHDLVLAKDIVWNKKPLIIQWAHSHTGDGTILVNSVNELKPIQEKFPERLARVSSYVHGPVFTLNVSVGKMQPENTKVTHLGNISYQITGIPPFTENPFSTIGNDWSLTHSLLNESEIETIEKMSIEIARKLQDDGWKGLFGIDVMRDDELDKIFLIEINARQPASTTYESQLQNKNRELGVDGQTIFESHLKALDPRLAINDSQDGLQNVIPINDGAQIIQRITRITQSISDKQISAFDKAGYQTILYSTNTEENMDLLRIQSTVGLMETHGRFNKRGKEVIDILTQN